jgi:hypothetical protein
MHSHSETAYAGFKSRPPAPSFAGDSETKLLSICSFAGCYLLRSYMVEIGFARFRFDSGIPQPS